MSRGVRCRVDPVTLGFPPLTYVTITTHNPPTDQPDRTIRGSPAGSAFRLTGGGNTHGEGDESKADVSGSLRGGEGLEMPDAMMTVMATWIAFNALLAMMLGLALAAKRATSWRRPGRVRDDSGARREADVLAP